MTEYVPATEGVVAGLDIGLAGPEDDPGLRRLLRETPMDGAVSLALAREPSFFHAAAVEGETATLVAREGDRIVAAFSRSVRPCWVDGVPQRLAYLSALRIAPGFRHGRHLLRQGFDWVRERQRAEPDVLPWCITTIVSDNARARRLLEAGLPGLPHYTFVEELVALAATPRWRALGARGPVRSATPSDRDAIVALLARFGARHGFGPVWDAATLTDPQRCRGLSLQDFAVVERGGRLVGCLARWDQHAFKQTVVAGYGGALRWARPLVNAAAPLLGTPNLPRPGGTLRHVYLSHLAVDGDDPDVALALVADAHDRVRAQRTGSLTTMLATSHPLLPGLRSLLRPREYRSRLYRVDWDGAPPPAAARPHLEVAVL